MIREVTSGSRVAAMPSALPYGEPQLDSVVRLQISFRTFQEPFLERQPVARQLGVQAVLDHRVYLKDESSAFSTHIWWSKCHVLHNTCPEARDRTKIARRTSWR